MRRRRASIAFLLLALCLAFLWYRQAHHSIPEPVLYALRHALAEAKTIPGWERDFAHLEIAIAQSRAGDISGAEATVRLIRDPDAAKSATEGIAVREGMESIDSPLLTRVRSWLGRRPQVVGKERIARGLSDLGRWEEAGRLAKEVPDPVKRSFALSDAVAARANSGDIEGALDMAMSSDLGWYRPLTLLRIASAARERGRQAEATLAIDRAVNLQYSVQHSGEVIKWAAKEIKDSGNLVRAQEYLANCLRDLKSVPSSQDKTYDLQNILEGYAAIGESTRAILLANTKMQGAERDRTLRAIATASATNGESIALKIAQSIANPVEKDQTLRSVAINYALHRDFHHARIADALVLDADRRDLCGRFIAVELTRAGRLAEGRDRLNRIGPGYNREHTIKSICRILAASSGPTPATDELKHGRSPYERAMGYVGIAHGLMDREKQAFPAITPYDSDH